MPLSGCYKLGNVSVAVWNITENEDMLLAMLPAEYSESVLEMKSPGRRLEWLAVRALIAHVYGPDERIVYNSVGKPFLKNADDCIGVSHTKGYAVLAYGNSGFGVDAELLSRNIMPLAGKIACDGERNLLDSECANEALLMKWCACEALFKLVGDLGGTFRDNVLVELPSFSSSGSFPVSLVGVDSQCGRFFKADYIIIDGLLLVICEPRFSSES